MRRRFVGLLTLACLAAVALVAASSLWAAGGSGAQGGGLRPLTADELARHDKGPPPDAQPTGASAAAGAQRFRDSGPGRQERAASRDAFRGLSGSGALAVSREKHPELAEALPPRMELSGRVIRYLDGGTSALVAGSKGSRGVVQSTMPLRATTASGRPAPVDAALTDRGDRFVAVNPATPIEFPKQADGRIRIGPLGVGLQPAGGSGPGVLRDGKVFYANTAKDSDTTLLSLPTGAETFTELRSPASPEEIRLAFDLSAGQTLRASSAPHVSAEIVSGKTVIADVSAPTAYDAQKQSLPVTSTIQGSTLVLHVAHRALDVAYPIIVDPQIGVLEPDQWYQGRTDSPGWGNYPAPVPSPWSTFRPEQGPGGWGLGLYTYEPYYNYYQPNSVLEWNYYGEFSRSSTAYVYAFEQWSAFSPGAVGGGWVPPCQYVGIFSLTDQWETFARACPQAMSYGYSLQCAGGDCNAATSPAQYPNYAVFGTQGEGWAYQYANDLYAANVYLTDRDNPTLSGGPPGAWTDDTTFSAQANQTGLGVNQLAISSPENPGWQPPGWSSGCSAEPNNHCPATTPPLTASTSGLPEGTSTINATASTLSGHTLTQNIGQVKVDRTPPSLAFGGTLTNGAVISQDSTLNVDATDGSNDGSPADARSGVASIDITLDPGTPNAQQLEHVTQGACQGPACPSSAAPACTAPDNCSLSASYTYPIANATDGTHTVQITATDNLGHTSPTKTVTFVVDTTPPVVTLGGSLAAADGQAAQDANGSLQIDASDANGDGIATSGVAKVDIYADRDMTQSPPVNPNPVAEIINPGCSPAQCPSTWSASWNLGAAGLHDGTHELEVVTSDLAGNQDNQSVSVNLIHTDPLPANQVTLDQASGLRVDGVAGSLTGASVANVGDINGDGVDDYLVGAPDATCNGRSQAGAAFLVYGGQTNSTLTLDPNQDGSGYIHFCGASAGDHAGTAVAAGGDINGDGTPDLLIGAPGNTSQIGVQLAGKVYAIFGNNNLASSDLAGLANAGNGVGFQINGPIDTSTSLGLGVAPVPFGAQIAGHKPGDFGTEGSVDGAQADGITRDSIVLGDSGSTASLLPDSGSVYVVFGKTDDKPVDATQLGNGGGFIIHGAAAFDQAGQSTAIIGDINSSGKAAVLLTAPGANPNARTSAGSAYVVFGKSDNGLVQLGQLNQPGGYPGYQIIANSGDGLINAAAAADVNGDDTPDLLLGGSGAGWVLYGKADTSTVDLTGGYAGYKMTAPGGQGSGYGTATVANAGDMYGDNGPGALVGFPAANSGQGASFLVYSQTDNTPVDLGAANSGNQFTRLDGPASSTSAQSADSTDDRGDSTPALLIGAPNANNNGTASGSVYLPGADQTAPYDTAYSAQPGAFSAQARHRRPPTPCWTAVSAGKPRAFPFTYPGVGYQRGSFLPPCRRTLHGASDISLTGDYRRTRQHRRRYNKNHSAYDNGNAHIHTDKLDKKANSGPDPIPIRDTFGDIFAGIHQDYQGCFTTYTYNPTTKAYTPNGHTTPDGTPCKKGGPHNGLIEVTGQACYIGTGGHSSYYGFRTMQAGPKQPSGDVGLQGFLAKGDLAYDMGGSTSSNELIAGYAYTGCGLDPFAGHDPAPPKGAPNTIPVGPDFMPPDKSGQHDRYIETRIVKGKHKEGSYVAYQVTNPPGHHNLEISTTGVSPAGGVVRAVIPDGHPFRWIDEINYKDPNADSATTPSKLPDACWVFGNANPGKTPIYGWTVYKAPSNPGDDAPSGTYQCPIR